LASEYFCHDGDGEYYAMSCATLSIADMAMAMANERATVRVNVSALDVTRATAKLRKKCPDEAPFLLLVVP